MRQLTEEELAEARKAARAIERILRNRPWDHPLLRPEERPKLRERARTISEAETP